MYVRLTRERQAAVSRVLRANATQRRQYSHHVGLDAGERDENGEL